MIKFINFLKQNLLIIKIIFLIIIIIIFLTTIYFTKITDYTISLTQFLTGVGGLITLMGLFWNIYFLHKRDKKSEKQIEQTRKQIDIQEKTRKDQQFLDAIKLIEESNEINSKIAYLKILENLANEDIGYRQRILDYLGNYSNRLKDIFENIKYEIVGDIFLNEGETTTLKVKNKEFNIDLVNVENNSYIISINDFIEKINKKRVLNKNKIRINILDENISSKGKNSLFLRIRNNNLNKNELELKFYKELDDMNLYFEKECYLLIRKIINIHNIKAYTLNISNIFIPFLRIENYTTFLTLFANYPENLPGLQYYITSSNGTKIQPNYVPDYANIQNVKRIYFERDYGKGSTLLNIKRIFNLSNKIDSIHFEKINFTLDNFVMGERKYFFIESSFYNVKFKPENENEIKDVKKNNWYSKLTFNKCYFGAYCEFENFIFQELYFKETKISKEYPIKGLETVQILSNDKEKINEMIVGFKDLIKKNNKIGIPQFINAKWAEKELKQYKKKLIKNV